MLEIWQRSGFARGTKAHRSLAVRTLACLIVFVAGARPAASYPVEFGSPSPLRVAATGSEGIPVTAVAGESWLSHLHRTLGETSMGKTDRLGPPALAPGEEASGLQPERSLRFSTRTVVLHGADLYRMNCQGCHGESGIGAPPEIGSVIDPVRATSVTAVMERMKKVGMNMSRAEAAGLAKQSKTALLQRLHKGGQEMPAFPHLSQAEVRSLIAYLKQLAGLPNAEKEQIAIRESPARVGELIVKSTCHTCHSAAGRNPSPEQLWDGAIPPLNTLTARTNQSELVRKVTSGAPIVMGTPPLLCRGRMPVFYYLKENEAADVYQYLTLYPPEQSPVVDSAVPMPRPDQAGVEVESGEKVFSTSLLPNSQALPGNADMRIAAFPFVAGFFVILLMAGGVFVTVREFTRMSAESAYRKWVARNAKVRILQKPTMVFGAELMNAKLEELCAKSEELRVGAARAK